MSIDDIKIYLPKFLSSESEKELFAGLKDFPNNIDGRLYTSYLKDPEIIYQGDGLKDLLVVNLPSPEIRPVPSIILSNTCDIALENIRNFPSQIVYAPIFNLKKYRDKLYSKSRNSKKQIVSHIDSVRHQRIGQFFFLPKIKDKIDDSIVFLDKVCNFPNKLMDRDNLKERRLFTLSDYGAYLFLLKLSIHFTRIKDNVERRSTLY
jgi:hypothetical protein